MLGHFSGSTLHIFGLPNVNLVPNASLAGALIALAEVVFIAAAVVV